MDTELEYHMRNAPQELKGRNGGHNSNIYGPQVLKAIAVESKSICPLVTRRLSLSWSETAGIDKLLALKLKGQVHAISLQLSMQCMM